MKLGVFSLNPGAIIRIRVIDEKGPGRSKERPGPLGIPCFQLALWAPRCIGLGVKFFFTALFIFGHSLGTQTSAFYRQSLFGNHRAFFGHDHFVVFFADSGTVSCGRDIRVGDRLSRQAYLS